MRSLRRYLVTVLIALFTLISFVAALQAAERGAGVALALEPFIAESERRGTIRRLLPVGHVTGSYWLVHPSGAQRNRALQTFKKWLLAELAKRD